MGQGCSQGSNLDPDPEASQKFTRQKQYEMYTCSGVI